MVDKNINFNRYFLSIIQDFDESTLLSPDLNGQKIPKFFEDHLEINKENLQVFCKKNSISNTILFLGAVAIALNKFNFSNRNLIFHENNTILTTNFKNRKITIKDYLMEIQKDYDENLKYAKFSVDEIINKYDFKPGFHYSFNGKIDISSFKYRYDFYLNVLESSEKFTLSASYNGQLYSEDYVHLFLKSIETIINQFLSSHISKLTLSDICLVKENASFQFKDIQMPLIHKRFEKQVEMMQDNIALVSNGERLTYAELNDKANKIANALIKNGVGPKNNILVMLPRNSDLIASIMGILKAGCAFIPIDPSYPKKRIKYIYENSKADYIIADSEIEGSIKINDLLKEENVANPDVDIDGDDLAYVIYTSGSTGKPKGVMGCHKNITSAYSQDENNEIYNEYVKMNRNLGISTVSFVAFFSDFMSLTFGTTLILANDDEIENIQSLARLMQNEKPDALTVITPSRLKHFLEHETFTKELSSIDYIAICGEMVTEDVLSKLSFDETNVYIAYGSTETSGFATLEKINDLNNDLTIGKSVHNVISDVRDIDGKLVPQGVMGELYIGGNGIAKGYYNLNDESSGSFLTINNVPFYKTGDYAILTPNGKIKLNGRIDNQIKLRGLRIEIGEVESNISRYPNIKMNAVVIKKINGQDHLCAYFTSDEEINTNELKEYLKERLTKYMVPTVFMQLDEMPKTPNGKIAVRKLPKPKLDLELVLPETKTEKTLFEIASDISKTAEFGVTDDLYAIGFTSLSLMKFNASVHEKLGVNLNISTLIDNPTIRDIANLIENSRQSDNLAKIIEDSKNSMYIPLTENQLGIYYECAQNPDIAQYNLPILIRFDRLIDAEKLKEAVIKTIDSYPYLKTRIVMHEDQLMLKRDDSIDIEEIPIVEVAKISDEEIQNADSKIFDLVGGQLFRAKIYVTDDETILFFDIHHLITDGESIDRLFKNLAYAYEGKELDSEVIDGYANALIEAENENDDEYISSEKYFHDLLTQEVDSTILTPDLKGNPDIGELKSVSKNINPHLIREFCADERISPNVLFMASTILNLNKYTFSDKSLITTIFNGRLSSSYFNTQGFLVKTLPIVSINEDRNISVRQLLSQIDRIWKETIKHSNYPYTKIAEEFQLKPEFMYTYNNRDDKIIAINDNEYQITYLETIQTNYKISFDINESEDNIELFILYNDQLYSEKYVKTFLNGIINTVNEFISENIENLRINEIELYKGYEIPAFSAVDNPFIHKRFEKQVKENPDNIALVATDAALTNAELNIRANRIANALIDKGIKAKSNILIMLPRDSNLIAAIIGVLKAGCSFIPIALEYPKDRIEYIYENSRADYIITVDGKSGNELNINELIGWENTSNPDVDIAPDDLAYIIYTSGSTGNPKGVMISHENVCNETESNPKCEYDNLLSIATIAFDPSLEDILTGITNGIKIILANDSEIKNIVDLIELIKKHKPQVMEFTPSRLLSYLEVEEFCEVIDCAKCIVMGGEQFSAKAFIGVKKYTDAKVCNSYGPTETTITSNYKEITDSENITVGKALKNYVTEVRDIDGKLLPKGVMGELYIGGIGVGKGYYNMPDKTEEAYLTINNIPYYRSGDYAIEFLDGDIDIKGRIDNQIKLRGLRIEIGEIESSITKFPNIKNAVVVIRQIYNNDHLCAYFTAEKEIGNASLKEFLKERLTDYMVPTVFMQLDEIPQLLNGKIDVKELPEPKLELENVKPENETEQKLFDIISDLIETDEFGTTDDLYTLGYTSLTLMKLNTLIYKEMNVNLDISVLFNSPTIKKLAGEISGNDGQMSKLDEFIEMSKDMKYFPLSENQLGLYYECMQNQGKVKYTMPSITRFDNNVDPVKLKESIIKAIEAHPYIKTRIFVSDDGSIMQERDDSREIDEIEIIDIDSIDDDEIIKNDVKAFSFGDEQLFRFKMYNSPDETVLFSDFHHIITDGESQRILFEDIGKAYDNEEIEKEIVDGYVFSLIENDMQNSERYESAKEFFDDKLSQKIDSTVLIPNIAGNPEDGEIKRISTTIDSTRINKFCLENSIGHNSLFMSALILGLNKFTSSDETLITTIFNGRSNPNYYNTQGFLVKTFPLIIKNENRQLSIRKFIKEVDEVWVDSISNCIYPYTKISDDYRLKPEFFYSYAEGYDSEGLVINGKDYENYELVGTSIATEYKIDINVFKKDTFTNIVLKYNDQLYTEDYAKIFLESIINVLNQFIETDIDKSMICDISLIEENENYEFLPVETPFVHKRFEEQAEINPDNIALIATDKTLTYAELNENANRVANALIKRGVKPKSNILVMLKRNSNLISAILGILKAGCAFIPIDLEYPAERINYIYENSQADYLIHTKTEYNILDIEELLDEDNAENPNVDMDSGDTAYMIYTSGSTGKPKGIMTSHLNITNLFSKHESNLLCQTYSRMNKVLALSTVSFDAFLLDFMGLTFGLALVLANDNEVKNIDELAELMHKEKPDSITFTTPSRALQYLENKNFKKEFSSVKYIAVGGEMVPKELISNLLENYGAEIYSIYGPTETTVICNATKITDADNITVGKSLYNCITEIRDIDGKLLPNGVMGELYIGGYGVAGGYYKLEDKTKEVFIEINGIPYYRSGDYAIEKPNGEIIIRGRIDNQIKLRGLRIEIGEIESNIGRFPGIKHNIVVIKKINDTEHLCSYFTAEKEIDRKLLKRYLQSKLTKYMVPTVFIQIDEMPQTPNGKTDLKALPEPSLALTFAEPETKTEKKLFELVKSLSEVDEFGITDDLYTLGFSSLTLMKLNSLIHAETGVNIEVSDLFNNPTIQSLSYKVDNNIGSQIDIPKIIENAKTMDLFPLTPNQLGIYYECMQTEEIKYTMPCAVHFNSDVDPFKLKQAIIHTIESHPYFKTRIVTTSDGELRQKRCDDAEIEDIEIVEADSITNEYMVENDIKPIPLDDNQLFRFKIYKTPEETVLFYDIHHIITDGVSRDLVFGDILNAYNGEELSEETVDGYAYSLIENEIGENEVSKEYYKNKFSQGFESTVLTPNLNGNPDEGEIKLVKESINSTFVRMFCQDHPISPNVLFMSATILALNKFTFSDKALITTIFNGRSNSNYFNTQAMLVKTIPIMVGSENRDMLVEDFINVVDKNWKESLIHNNYPYTKLSEEYQLKPEFFYAYHGLFKTDNLELLGHNYKVEELDGTVTTDYKINMDIYDGGENISFYVEYNDQIYTKEYVTEFMAAIKYILVQFFVNDMDKLRINEIELAPRMSLPEFEEIENPFLHKRFEAQAAQKPDELALVAVDESLSYDELNKKSNRIAHALINRGVKPRSNILIMLPRDSDLIASMLGVLKAGCAFIPLDLKFPKERIDYIYENSQADYIINVDGIMPNSLSIKDLLKDENIENPDVEISPDDLTYMIYTSGSTGNPKGVMISHENICNQVQNPKSQYESLLCLTTIAFDVSMDDILTSLSNGLKLVLASDTQIRNIPELIQLISDEKPEVSDITPSRLASYLEVPEFCEVIGCFKCLFLGGEQFSAKVYEDFKKYCDAIVYNCYGPTETTITSNNKEITDVNDITVGLPLDNYVTDVRDIDRKLVPQGVMGELYIGGKGVGKGYYNMPDKTKEVFLTIGGIPYYRSGDYAIEMPNGEIDIKGRIDNQIKLRGLRIEIGEIESNISNFPKVKQAVVVIKKIRNNEHLCAYFTADEEIVKDELKEYLGERLTEYMVPTVFMQIDEMPQTPNGKTDIKALPEPKLELTYVPPKNKLEQAICAIYSSVLDIEIVGAEDNFFEIGGTSLIASKLIIELLKQDYDVKYDDLFRNQTPRKLAGFLSGDEISKDLDVDIIENYDYSKINSLLEKNTFENFAKGRNLELGNVLLTGVTGFLGAHVLYEYIKNEEGTIYCMLRKGGFDTCEERFRDLMNYYFDEDFSDIIGSRIILSEGDITSLDDFKKLEKYQIDTIINCAAIVKHYTHDDYIFRVNVDGVINGLEFAEANNITYVQISTVSVLDMYDEGTDIGGVSCDEKTLYWRQDLSNKYVNSKLLAERMVLEKAVSGLNTKIIRVGNLMARYSDGMFQKNYDTNAFLNNLKAIVNLKATVPAISGEMVEFSQIDYVAKATLALAKTPKESTVFHALNDKLIPFSDVFNVLNSFGFDINEVTPEEFRKIYNEHLDEDIQGIITADLTIDDFDVEYDNETESVEDDAESLVRMDLTLDILDFLGFDWPECDEVYLEKFIRHLNDVGYFD